MKQSPPYSPLGRHMLQIATAAILLALSQIHGFASPAVFNATESAKALDVIGVQGCDFGSVPSVLLAPVNSSGVVGTSLTLSVVFSSPTYVAAQIPSGYSLGMYQARIQDANGVSSSPLFLNQARITQMEFPEIDPGRQFRLFGRNLRMTGATPSVRFVHTSGSSTAGTVLSGGDAYIVTVQAPASLVSGTYTLYYSNGFGGSLGEVTAPVALPVQQAGTDAFGLGVPWMAEFAVFANQFYDVAPSGGDDTVALQTAINTANANGGGVVRLGSGTYNIGTFTNGTALTLKSNVVIQGSGTNTTTVAFAAPAGVTTTTGMILAASGARAIGISNLMLKYNATTSGTTGLPFMVSTNTDTSRLFVKGVTFDTNQWGQGALRLTTSTGSRMLISNCSFINPRRNGRSIQTKDYGSGPNKTSWVYIKNCSWPNMILGPLLGGSNILFESNNLVFDENYFDAIKLIQPTFAGLKNRVALSGPDIVLLSNSFSHVGPAYYNENDGENIMAEDPGPGAPDFGTATATSSTTLADSAKAWTTNALAGYEVVIVDGRGRGQLRTVASNTANTLTLTSTWAITPDAGSKYVVLHMNVPRLMVKANKVTHKAHTVMLYQGAYDVAIVNNEATNSAEIWTRNVLGLSGTIANSMSNLQMRVLIADNVVLGTDPSKPSCIKTEVAHNDMIRFAPGLFLLENRRNSVTTVGLNGFELVNTLANGFAFWHPQGGAGADAMEGVIYDGNSVTNALNAYGWLPPVNGATISNETNTTIWREDYDITHRDGILYDGASLSSGTLRLSGTSYMDIGTLTLSGTMTIEGWVATTSATATILTNRPAGAAEVSISAGKVKIWDNSFTAGSMSTSSSVNDGIWHHFAWTSDGSTEILYLDGTAQVTRTNPRSISTGKGLLGKSNGFLAGGLDEIRVWNTVRTQAQIQQFKNTQLAGDEPGLVQYWRFSEPGGSVACNGVLPDSLNIGVAAHWFFDENQGGSVYDASGNNNTGAVLGSTPYWTSGISAKFGAALHFDGTSNYVNVPLTDAMQGTSALTVHATVKIDAHASTWSGNYRGIINTADAAQTGGWTLGTYGDISTNAVGFYFERQVGSGLVVRIYGPTGLQAGRFYSVAATYDAATSSTKLYVDGVLQATSVNTRTTVASSAGLSIGKRMEPSVHMFYGVIDDARIYNRVLSATEIENLHAP